MMMMMMVGFESNKSMWIIIQLHMHKYYGLHMYCSFEQQQKKIEFHWNSICKQPIYDRIRKKGCIFK